MEFLRPSRRRSVISEIIYILLNIAVAVLIFVTVLAVESPLPAFALVLLSKWRVLAVRPQYWWTNIVSNMVDVIVGLSFVVLLYAASGAQVTQIALTVLYIAWLLVLKPRSARALVVLQAGIGLFVGVSALEQISYSWWSSTVVVVMWAIGYFTARHALTAYKEPHYSLLSLIWGLVMAELGWITFHWSFAYNLHVTGGLMLSQAALFAFLLSFLAERVYASYHKNHQLIKLGDIVLPLLLTLSTIGLLLFANSTTQ